MKQSLGGSTEAAFSIVEASAGIGNRAELHPLSPGWSRVIKPLALWQNAV